MSDLQQTRPAQSATFVSVRGTLPALSAANRRRLAVFLLQGNTILSEAPVSSGGSFQIHVARDLVRESGVFAVLGPKGMDPQSLAGRAALPRKALSSATARDGGGLVIDFAGLGISDQLIDPWWIWCHEYTVSGTLETASNCPVGAQVTVYNVTTGVSGLVETPIVTVTTDANGNFTATFNWCSRLCWWPCWPVWWQCWPWWWELDILAVIENLEQRLQVQSTGAVNFPASGVAPLRQPAAPDLMTGVAFAASRTGTELRPDSARTAMVAAKLADPRIRALFPWWWWCCDNPNIVFSASQGSTIVLDEDPNLSTRWCFASGQTVSLTTNAQGVGACQVQTSGPCGFSWSSVGDEPGGVLFDNISMGYAVGTLGNPASNMAFQGSLNLNGLFSGDCTAFYQVLAGEWGGGSGILTGGNPARGGTPAVASEPLAVLLTDTITIWSGASLTQQTVILGPCSFAGIDNLYMTRAQRQNPPAGVTGLPPFPTIGAGDLWGWDAPNLVLTVPAAELANPATGTGGVTLSIVPYDITGAALPTATQPYEMGPDLVLMVDTTALTTATIDWVLSGVFNSDHTPATLTTPAGSNCPAYEITTPGGGYVLIHTTVVDSAGHLYEYQIQTQYGSSTTLPASPADRDYAQAPSSFAAAATPPPYGVDAGYQTPNDLPLPPPAPSSPPYAAAAASNWTFVGGGDTAYIAITESCCYDFQLWAGKRVTDGQTFFCTWGNPAFQTVNITVAAGE
jgi:hypothetical protein